MVSQHKQDWEQRHTALARGERSLLWTDEEVRGEVRETCQFAEGARRARSRVYQLERATIGLHMESRKVPQVYHSCQG